MKCARRGHHAGALWRNHFATYSLSPTASVSHCVYLPHEFFVCPLRLVHARAAAFQNGRPAALRLFLGAGVSVAVRNADLSGNARIARSRERFFEAYFHMPFIPDFAERLEVAGASMDGIWALSYGRHGQVTEHYRQEATAGAIDYLRRFLPEFLPRKPLTQKALERIFIPIEHMAANPFAR